MRYTLLLAYPEMTADDLGDDATKEGMAAFDSYAKALDAAGVLVSAEVLQQSGKSTTVTLKSGELRIQNGPFAGAAAPVPAGLVRSRTRPLLGGGRGGERSTEERSVSWCRPFPRVLNRRMDSGVQSLVDNLPKNTGRSLGEWFGVLEASGLEKHTDLMNHLKRDHGVSHGFANQIALQFRERGTTQSGDNLVDAQYTGAKAPLRPLYDSIIGSVGAFGPDVEIAPKRTGVSLRRHKQFALIEAPSSKRLQIGINLKGEPGTDRLLVAGGMCTHKVNVSSADEIDAELLAWLRRAYDAG